MFKLIGNVNHFRELTQLAITSHPLPTPTPVQIFWRKKMEYTWQQSSSNSPVTSDLYLITSRMGAKRRCANLLHTGITWLTLKNPQAQAPTDLLNQNLWRWPAETSVFLIFVGSWLRSKVTRTSPIGNKLISHTRNRIVWRKDVCIFFLVFILLCFN